MDIQQTVKCKVCNADIPKMDGYITWCDKCGWNMEGEDNIKRNAFERFYDSMGKKSSEQRLKSLQDKPKIGRKITLTKIFAFLLSIPVYILHYIFYLVICTVFIYYIMKSTALAAGPFFVYTRYSPKDDLNCNIILIIAAILLLCLGVYIKLKRKRNLKNFLIKEVIKQNQSPVLYDLVNKISEKLRVSKIDGIIIDDRFTASVMKSGVRNKKILMIGLPLFYILNNNEKVALIAHEIAHDASNAVVRGRFVGRALDILEDWYIFVTPDEKIANIFSINPRAGIIIPGFRVLSKLILIYWLLLSVLMLRDDQRAEYYADYSAATLSGTDAAVQMLEKHYHAPTLRISVGKSIRYNSKKLLSDFAERIDLEPEREKKRILKLLTSDHSRINASPLATSFRIECLKSRKMSTPYYPINFYDFDKLDMELSSIQERIEARLKRKN